MSWVGGKAPPSSVGELRDLLQRGAHAPCARRGCSAPSTCADSRAYRISHLARRSPSALRSDGIIGTHSGVSAEDIWVSDSPIKRLRGGSVLPRGGVWLSPTNGSSGSDLCENPGPQTARRKSFSI